jgi:hypothetical protein
VFSVPDLLALEPDVACWLGSRELKFAILY